MRRVHFTGISPTVRVAPLLATPLGGCAGSPTLNVFGSFFPSWMLCVVAGVILTVVAHRILAKTAVDKSIPAPFLVYVSLTAAFTFAIWLVWLG